MPDGDHAKDPRIPIMVLIDPSVEPDADGEHHEQNKTRVHGGDLSVRHTASGGW